MEVDAGIAERDWCIFRVRWAWRPVCGGGSGKAPGFGLDHDAEGICCS